MRGPRAMKKKMLTNWGYCLMGEVYMQSKKTHGLNIKNSLWYGLPCSV